MTGKKIVWGVGGLKQVFNDDCWGLDKFWLKQMALTPTEICFMKWLLFKAQYIKTLKRIMLQFFVREIKYLVKDILNLLVC